MKSVLIGIAYFLIGFVVVAAMYVFDDDYSGCDVEKIVENDGVLVPMTMIILWPIVVFMVVLLGGGGLLLEKTIELLTKVRERIKRR